jgi:transposase-like protein
MEMVEERELSIAHTIVMHCIHQYEPKLDERIRWDRSVQNKGKFTLIFFESLRKNRFH